MRNILYLHGLGCGGDSLSLLNAEEPDFLTATKMLDINIAWHPSLSLEKGDSVDKICRNFIEERDILDFFVVEGAVPTGPDGSGEVYQFLGRPFADLVKDLAGVAQHTVAVGTCAVSGGIPAAGPNPSQSSGMQFKRSEKGGIVGADYRSKSGFPVINIPGCSAHPDWIIETLYLLAGKKMGLDGLDHLNRPAHFYSNLAHSGCPKNEFYEFKASAEEFGQMGCLFEKLGCRGTQCESDCNIRLWMGRTGSCTRAGYPCTACTSQEFPLPDTRYFDTEWLANVPKFLPRDVPKAWYIGMVGLSKMATPERLKINAVSTHNAYKNLKNDRGTDEK
jgi:NiFe hydrogenase small subunit HydA